MKYFLDTYAIIEIIKGNNRLKKFLNKETITLKNNLAELYYSFIKEDNKEIGDYFFKKLLGIVTEFPVYLIPKAMIFRYKYKSRKFSYTDCFGYIFAKEKGYRFVTGDKQFKGFKNTEFID